jgi:hypothetical protein
MVRLGSNAKPNVLLHTVHVRTFACLCRWRRQSALCCESLWRRLRRGPLRSWDAYFFHRKLTFVMQVRAVILLDTTHTHCAPVALVKLAWLSNVFVHGQRLPATFEVRDCIDM